MSPLEALSGTLVNTATVLLGAGLGLALRGRLPGRVGGVLLQAIGLVTLVIGVGAAGDLARVTAPPGVILGLVALAGGAALGEWWRLGDRLEGLGDAIKRRVRGQGRFTEGFVAASLLFCVGPMTIVGSLQNGLVGDASLLLLKSTLDGISSIALAATFGFGVVASAAVVLVFQGGGARAAGAGAPWRPGPAPAPRGRRGHGGGGRGLVGLGITLLELRRIAVAAMLPALPLVVVLYEIARRLA